MDVTTTVFRSLKAKGLTAQQGNGLGFHLPDVAWGEFGVRKVAFVDVAKHDVTGFMEKGFYRQSGNGADRDLPATFGVTLGVAVQVLERNTVDVQRGKGSFFVPFRDRGRLVFCTIGLRKNEPY